MKKKTLLTSALFALLAFSGCTPKDNSSPNSEENNLSNESSPSISDVNSDSSAVNENEATYVVKVVYEDGTLVTDSSVVVQLCDDANCYTFKLGNDGTVSKSLAKKDYTIHLLNVDEGYTYNPNVYNVDANNHEATVVLYKVNQYLSGTGERYNAYEMNEGVYLSKNTNSEEVFYYFTPTRPGVYTIESLAKDLDTFVNFYGGNKYNVPEDALVSDDDSGSALNFKLEFEVERGYFIGTDEVDENGNIVLQLDENGNCIPGSSYVFGITAKNLPANAEPFAIKVTYEHEYVAPVITTNTILPQATLTKYADNEDLDSSLVNVLLDGSCNAVLNPTDGYYHVGSEEGPVLLVNLNNASQYLDRAICYLEMEGGNAFTFVTSETERENYTQFVAAYSQVCNSDGVYPVTEELKEFLTKLKDGQYYFGDFGWLSWQIPYEVDSASEWMFACCYYASAYNTPVDGDGSEENPYLVETDSVYRFNVSATPTNFRLFTIFDCVLDIKSLSANVVLSIDGFVAGELEDGFNYNLWAQGRTPYDFTIYSKDGTDTVVVFEIIYHEDEEEVGGRDNIIAGNNVITLLGNEAIDGVELHYVAPVTGDYYFYPNEQTCLWYDDYGTTVTILGSEYGSLELSLEEGQELVFFIGREDYAEGDCAFSLFYSENFEIESDFELGDNSIAYFDGQYDEYNGFSGYFVTLEAGDYKFTVGEGTAASIDWMYMLSSDDPSVTLSLKFNYPVAVYLTNPSGSTEGNLLLNIEYLGPTVYQNDFVIGENTFHYDDGEQAMWNGFSGHFVIESTGNYTFTVAEGTGAWIDDGYVSQYIPDDGVNSVTLYLFEGDVISISLVNATTNIGEGDLVITIDFEEVNGGNDDIVVTETFTLGTNTVIFANGEDAINGVYGLFVIEQSGEYVFSVAENTWIYDLDWSISVDPINGSNSNYYEAGTELVLFVSQFDPDAVDATVTCSFTIELQSE